MSEPEWMPAARRERLVELHAQTAGRERGEMIVDLAVHAVDEMLQTGYRVAMSQGDDAMGAHILLLAAQIAAQVHEDYIAKVMECALQEGVVPLFSEVM